MRLESHSFSKEHNVTKEHALNNNNKESTSMFFVLFITYRRIINTPNFVWKIIFDDIHSLVFIRCIIHQKL